METEPYDIPKIFGKNVQMIRKRNGYTQEQLCEKLGITQKHLSIIETGNQFASAALISKIASELKVSPAALFGEDINQKYMDSLYARLATYFENKINRIKSEIIEELKEKKDSDLLSPDFGKDFFR